MQQRIEQTLQWFMPFARAHLDRAEGEVRDLVRGKIRHTMRVLAHARNIVRELGPVPALAEAAELAAILHDVGRFPQLIDRASFDDHTGYNHGEEGASLLAGTSALNGLDAHWREVVLTAVRFHNRDVIPDGLDPDSRRVVEILRDADKLDVLRGTLKYISPHTLHGKALKSGLVWHETEVSPEVLELSLARRLIPFQAIKWSNDFILFLSCWVYDLHFPYAYVRLAEPTRFGKLMSMLPDNERFAPVKAQLADDLARLAAGSARP